MNSIGLQIYNWRVREGLSIDDAAKSLDLSRATLYDIEKGKRKPRSTTQKKIESIIGPLESDQAEETVASAEEETLETTYVSFTDRLARSRGFSSMEEYRQSISVAAEEPEQEDIPSESVEESEEERNPADENVVEVIGYLKGVQAATKIDLSNAIDMLMHYTRKHQE